jgi:membrane protein
LYDKFSAVPYLVTAVWTASVGFSTIQDSLNVVYRVKERRPYWQSRLSAIAVTAVQCVLVTLILALLLSGDFFVHLARHELRNRYLAASAELLLRTLSWLLVLALLSLFSRSSITSGPTSR